MPPATSEACWPCSGTQPSLNLFFRCFAKWPVRVHNGLVLVLPLMLLLLLFHMQGDMPLGIGVLIPVHLLVLFVVALVCHGELALSRPPPRYLTEFYLWLSVGGV